MKRFISIFCICLILALGGAAAVYCFAPGVYTRIYRKFSRPTQAPTITLDPSFQYVQSEGLTLLVSEQFPLEEPCCPDDLVNLYEHKERSFELARADIELRKPAFEAAQEMFTQAKADGVSGFIINSGYRTRERQGELYGESDTGYVNAPGESEHELGLTFDVTTRTDKPAFDQTEQCAWLFAHAHEYGFILRYPEGKEAITGVPYESWHYRYVGKEAAQIIHDNGWCLEEYAAAQ
jgi:D-alanyl-D-alanine carboxypeptidase